MRYSIALLLLLLSACKAPIAVFEIDSGEVERSLSPIYVKSEVKLKPASDYYLKDTDNGKHYPIEVIKDGWMTLIDSFPANTTLTLELKRGIIALGLYSQVTVDESDGIKISIDGRPILIYQNQTIGPKGNRPDYYNRSGFIHPLYSPNGEILTDGFPVGHTHQNAIFNAWTNTTFKGQKVDFWNRHEQLGTIAHVETIAKEEGVLGGLIKTKLSHISLAHGEVLEEVWQINVYPIKEYFLFDLKSTQVNTSQDTLFLNEYLYGGMAYRGSKEWNRDDTDHFTNSWKILTSEGYTNETANHTQAAWVDASGLINGKRAGLTVFGFPDNFRSPQTIRVHPEMPYWVYSPVVDGAFYIAPGQQYISRYRYLVHDGSIDKALLERIQADMEHPVEVKQIK